MRVSQPEASPQRVLEHPLAAAIVRQDRCEVERLLLEGHCGANECLLVGIEGSWWFRRPLELALYLSASSFCRHSSAPCKHCDCLFADADSLLHLLIRLGAKINFYNCFIDHVILFGPSQPLCDEDYDLLSSLNNNMRTLDCNDQQWEAVRWLYAKDEHLILDAVRGCVENGLQWDSRVPRHCTITRTVLVRAMRWFLGMRRTLIVLLNLWLSGFSLARPGPDIMAVSEFQMLPVALQMRIFSLAAEALAISRAPVKLELQARSCIRKKLPQSAFRSSANQLHLPSKLRSFILFAERF